MLSKKIFESIASFFCLPILVGLQGGHIEACIRLFGENEQGNFASLFLDVLDEDSDLHRASDLSSDGGHSWLVAKECVHGDAVLNDQRSDWYERKNQHVEYEEFLSAWSGWVDVVASYPPYGVLHALNYFAFWL